MRRTVMHSFVDGPPILRCENKAGMHEPQIGAVIKNRIGRFFRDGDVDDLERQKGDVLYPTPCQIQVTHTCLEMTSRNYAPQYQERVVFAMIRTLRPDPGEYDRPSYRHRVRIQLTRLERTG